jgi:hypothetical protein
MTVFLKTILILVCTVGVLVWLYLIWKILHLLEKDGDEDDEQEDEEN